MTVSRTFPYKGSARIRFADTDANGHMYFGNYLVIADEVMSEYWAELGWDFNKMHEHPSLTFSVNVNIDFLSECLGGDMVDVAVRFSRLGTKSLTAEFEMTNQRTAEMASRGTMTSVFVDKETRKGMPIPEAFRHRILEKQPELLPLNT